MAFNLVRYSQQDPQWRDNPIGGGPDTIGYIGCALTCVSMYISGWGFSETPASLNKKLNAHGGFSGEAIVWSAVTGIYPQVKSAGLTVCTDGDAPLAQIDAALAAGNPVIAEVDYKPEPGLQTHWVLLTAKKGDDYVIQDPWPSPPETKEVTLMSRFSQGQPLKRTIKAVAWYQVSGGTPVPSGTPGGSTTTTPSTPAPTPVETDLFVKAVAAATAGIKLHAAPSLDSPANYAEMPGVQLRVIEDKAGALAKIGTQQWLFIRDPQGHQGYVAAWYVEKVATAAPSSGPAPEPAPAETPPSSGGTTPSTPSTPATPPASEPKRFQVVVLSSVGGPGLSVRQGPSQGAALVNVEKAGARLTVIEPVNTATAKIGAAGQWLAIKATNNRTGYVMAQYVKAR
jgi:peptidase C39-like protein